MNTSINIVMDRACTIYHHAKFELQMKLVQREKKREINLCMIWFASVYRLMSPMCLPTHKYFALHYIHEKFG